MRKPEDASPNPAQANSVLAFTLAVLVITKKMSSCYLEDDSEIPYTWQNKVILLLLNVILNFINHY